MKLLPLGIFCLLYSVDAVAGPAAPLVAPLVTAFAGAAGSAIVGKLFGGKGPKAPSLPKQKTAPTPDEEARRRAAERQQQRKYANMGRASTVLSENNTLG